MGSAEKVLVWTLRLSAGVLLLALVPAVMPFAWMVAVGRWVEVQELPELPIVGYLTRSLSAMYALHGALVLYVSFDVRRHLPVVRCLAVLGIVFGSGMIVLDWAVGMPAWWIVCEGPPVVALGVLLLWLAGRIDRCPSATR